MTSKYVLEAMKNDRAAVLKKGPIKPRTFEEILPNQRTTRQKEILRQAYVWVEEVHARDIAACDLRIALYEEEGIIDHDRLLGGGSPPAGS